MVYLLGKRLRVIGGFVFQLRRTEVVQIRNVFDNARCSDPRDRIYGIKSLLLEDQQGLCGQPDYIRSTIDLYSEFTRNYIMGYPIGLTILRQCELSQIPHNWSRPSWVPDWSTRASFHWGKDTFASSQIQGFFAFPEIGTLGVLGVSRIVVTKTQSAPKFYYRDWSEGVEFLRRITPPHSMTTGYPSGGSLLRAIARTVLCGASTDFVHVRDGNYPTSKIAEAEVTRYVSGDNLGEEDYKMGSDAQRFLKRMDWGLGGNNFILCTDGFVGVAPPSTKIGDEIFVIVGCQQPLVLRNCLKGSNRYSVVGECYAMWRDLLAVSLSLEVFLIILASAWSKALPGVCDRGDLETYDLES